MAFQIKFAMFSIKLLNECGENFGLTHSSFNPKEFIEVKQHSEKF
jgi:hypothetical protein